MEESMDSRYNRQIELPGIGEDGQKRLMSAKAVVTGAGGLGSPVLYYLAAAGIGTIRIIDFDTVDITNLNRQIIHFEDDIGREKLQSAGEKLQRLNKDIRIETAGEKVGAENAERLLSGCDIAIACVDNNETRYVLNATCVKTGIPLINGGIQGFEGYVMAVLPGNTPCYNCIFPASDSYEQPDAGRVSVLGATAGVIGSMMATEAVKVLLGLPVNPFFYYVDMLCAQIIPIEAKRADACPVCGSK